MQDEDDVASWRGRIVELNVDVPTHFVGLFGLFKYQSHYRPVTHLSGIVEKSGKTSILPVSETGRRRLTVRPKKYEKKFHR